MITVHDVGTAAGSVFIAMEFIDGETLTRGCETPRPWREVVAMLIAAGRGVATAHRAKIVHRDFKPDNVMIAGDGRPRVLDFGLARAASEGSGTVELPAAEELRELAVSSTFDAKLTETGAVMGAPAYMAPEQHTGGRVDERTDQFAFCWRCGVRSSRRAPRPSGRAEYRTAPADYGHAIAEIDAWLAATG